MVSLTRRAFLITIGSALTAAAVGLPEGQHLVEGTETPLHSKRRRPNIFNLETRIGLALPRQPKILRWRNEATNEVMYTDLEYQKLELEIIRKDKLNA